MDDVTFQHWQERSPDRFPEDYIERRLAKEARKANSIIDNESSALRKLIEPRNVLSLALDISGLRRMGERNALKIQVLHNRFMLTELPHELNGFKVLQISDMHFNAHEKFLPSLIESLDQVEYDLCVLTGDYRYRSFGSSSVAIENMRELTGAINTDILAILGNHDSITMVPDIEAMGVTVLLNEHVVIKKGSASLLIAGVDDPHYYRTDDIEQSLRNTQPLASCVSLLLAHSPELFYEAEKAGFNAYLCGHTHGGQICIAKGFPLYKNSRSPRWSLAGDWVHGSMLGYTSRGVGTSVINARFNCPPEMTVHEFVRC